MRYSIPIELAPGMVKDLQQLMGIHLVPSMGHPLYEHFVKFQGFESTLLFGLRIVPKEVLELATYANYIFALKSSWKENKIQRYLKHKLSSNKVEHVMGTIFEFQAAFHFLIQHRQVTWLPNQSSSSEFDIEVKTDSNRIVMVECTRKLPKHERVHNPQLLIDDICTSVKSKIRQAKHAHLPLLVAVFIPEEISWRDIGTNNKLETSLDEILKDHESQNISGVGAICYRRPKVRIVANETESEADIKIHETDSPIFVLRNRNAIRPFPEDFYPYLPDD